MQLTERKENDMKTKKIIVLTLVAVVVAIAVWYLLRGKTDDIIVTDQPENEDKYIKYINGIGYIFDSAGRLVDSIRNKQTSESENSDYDNLYYIYAR